MEEFQEADVLWPAAHHCSGDDDRGQQQHQRRRRRQHVDARRVVPLPAAGSSAPVGITGARLLDGDVDDGAEPSASFVPPHEIAARRRCSAEKAASSVCVGRGRTLKGRDLCSVRTAVLRMTGFLES